MNDHPHSGAAPVEMSFGPATVDETALCAGLEAVLLVAEQPVPSQVLADLFDADPDRVDATLCALAVACDEARRGFTPARVAGGWRLQTHPDQAGHVERFLLADTAAKLSRAAMETMAIVAYKQPISRAQVAMIRGVNTDGTMRMLAQRGYVAEIAIDPGPGQASLFGTTPRFLESLGLDSLAQLPELGDLVPPPDVMEALEASLRVDGEGQLRRRGNGSAADPAPAAATGDAPGEEPDALGL